MGNFILGHSDIGYKSTFNGGTWHANLGIENLQSQYITETARTTTLADLEIDITLGVITDIEIAVLGIVNHNLTATGTYRWRAYSDPARTDINNIYDSGVLTVGAYNINIPYKTNCTDIGSDITSVYWRLNITDSGAITNTDGYISIGRLFMGKKFNPDRGFDEGLKLWVSDDNSDILESHNGIESSIVSEKKRNVSFPLKALGDTVGDKFIDFGLRNGVTGACLFERDPDRKQEGLYTFICRQVNLSPLDFPNYNNNSLSINLRELL